MGIELAIQGPVIYGRDVAPSFWSHRKQAAPPLSLVRSECAEQSFDIRPLVFCARGHGFEGVSTRASPWRGFPPADANASRRAVAAANSTSFSEAIFLSISRL